MEKQRLFLTPYEAELIKSVVALLLRKKIKVSLDTVGFVPTDVRRPGHEEKQTRHVLFSLWAEVIDED